MKTYPSNLSKRERHMIIPLLPKRGNAHRQKWKWKVILNDSVGEVHFPHFSPSEVFRCPVVGGQTSPYAHPLDPSF